MTPRNLRRWSWLHKWSSLVCTVFMLLLCVTGLPLIFHHEIGHWLGTQLEAPEMPADAPRARLSDVVAAARAVHPDRVVQFVSQEADDDALWFVTLTPTPAPTDDFRSVVVDARTGLVVGSPRVNQGFLWIMLKLHVDLFAGIAGKLFLGSMGLLMVIAIVSGVVLYAPFMRRLAFGAVRRDRPARTRWLDLHNLIGIVTLVWALVVGATGVINTWADLLIKYWQYDQLQHLVGGLHAQDVVPEAERASLDGALANARAAVPGTRLAFIAFPGTAFSSPRHATFVMRGATPLAARLLSPVLIDARTGQVSATPHLPWYLNALLLSQPLHFGDYGGVPMKVIWALLDLATIVLLASGLYLWWAKRPHRVPGIGRKRGAYASGKCGGKSGGRRAGLPAAENAGPVDPSAAAQAAVTAPESRISTRSTPRPAAGVVP